jgi:phospholipid/cholesterol/gamma-HCH transport system ATP-binding protein
MPQPRAADPDRAIPPDETPAVSFEGVTVAFDDHVVLDNVSFAIRAGGLTFLLGASGSGKSVVLKLILGLLKPDAGAIFVHGTRVDTMTEAELTPVRADIGMLFQETALFDSMTVADNVGYRLREEMGVAEVEERRRAQEVLGVVGLGEHLDRMPSELSGGQRRRVAIARAMAANPHLLLLDDPTSGLDPITARTVLDEVVKVRDLQEVTVVAVTHQLPDAFYVARSQAVQDGDRITIAPAAEGRADADFILLHAGHVLFHGEGGALLASDDPHVRAFTTGWVPPLV